VLRAEFGGVCPTVDHGSLTRLPVISIRTATLLCTLHQMLDRSLRYVVIEVKPACGTRRHPAEHWRSPYPTGAAVAAHVESWEVVKGQGAPDCCSFAAGRLCQLRVHTQIGLLHIIKTPAWRSRLSTRGGLMRILTEKNGPATVEHAASLGLVHLVATKSTVPEI
jgi:hypothetical protein